MSWPKVNINDICRPKQWKTVSSANLLEEGYPVYGANGQIGFYSEFTHEHPTLMITCRGATCGNVHISVPKAYINGNAMALDELDTNKVFIKYLFYYFKSRGFIDVISGSAQPQITRQGLSKVEIPLPPLPVQKQIAEVLEKADTLRSQCLQMEQELNTLAQSVFLDMFGDPVSNPKNFDLVSLGSLSNVQIGPFGTMLHKSDYISGGIPLINPTHIVKSKVVPNQDLTITTKKYEALPQYHLEEGDIIMGRRGEMGRCAIVEGESAGYFCGTGSLFVRPKKEKLRARYLNDFLSSVSIKRWFEEQSLGATMPNLNKSIVKSVLIPLPSFDLQIQYESILENISNRLQNHKDLRLEVNNNFNSLMQRAFKGELKFKDVA